MESVSLENRDLLFSGIVGVSVCIFITFSNPTSTGANKSSDAGTGKDATMHSEMFRLRQPGYLWPLYVLNN